MYYTTWAYRSHFTPSTITPCRSLEGPVATAVATEDTMAGVSQAGAGAVPVAASSHEWLIWTYSSSKPLVNEYGGSHFG
jgi:hypothetical protein